MIIPPDVVERSGKNALFQMGFIMWEEKKAGEINHRSFYGSQGGKKMEISVHGNLLIVLFFF